MKKFMGRKSANMLALVLLPALIASAVAVNAEETLLSAAKTIFAGQTISETSTYSGGLTISEGVVLSAPEGKTLTMTVGGIQRNIKSGTYKDPVVLAVTEGYKTQNMGSSYILSAAAYINNGKYDKANKLRSNTTTQ